MDILQKAAMAPCTEKSNEDYKFEVLIGLPDEDPNFVNSSSTFFKWEVEDSWMSDELVKRIVSDVDKSELVDSCVISPVLGQIGWDRLSSGTKTLILLLYGDKSKIYNLTNCGDNCLKWLDEISKKSTFQCAIGHLPAEMPDSIFPIKIKNNGVIVNSYKEFVREYLHNK